MNNLKRISIILAVALIVACICPLMSVGAADALTVSASSAEGERGDTVEVVLAVDNNPGFAALMITVPQIEGFELISAKNGIVMSKMTQGKHLLWDSASDSTDLGTLVTLTFKILENAPSGVNSISVYTRECYNEKLQSVSVNISPIKIKVLGEPIVEETTAVTTEVTTEETTEVATEATTEVTTEVTTEDTTEETTEITTEVTTEVTTEATTEETTEVATESVTETPTEEKNLNISVENVEGARGDTVDVVLTVTNNPGFAALIITVPEIDGFELVSANNGSVMSTMTQGKNILWDSFENSTTVGSLVTLTFKIKGNAPLGETTFNILVRECFNDSLQSVTVKISPLKINVIDDPLAGESTEEDTENSNQTEPVVNPDKSEPTTGDSGQNNQVENVDKPAKKPIIGCIGEIGAGAMIITTLLAGAWFFIRKH